MKWLYVLFLMIVVVGCDTDSLKDDEPEVNNNNNKDITLPSLKKDLTTATYATYQILLSFDNGGDDTENMSATVFYETYAGTPSEEPTKSDLTERDNMRIYKSSRTITYFESSHATGNAKWVYYYVRCSNSKGSIETDIFKEYIPQSYR